MKEQFHSVTDWNDESNRLRGQYQTQLEAVSEERQHLRQQIQLLRDELRISERTGQGFEMRQRTEAIQLEAEQVRIRLVRDALLTVHGLPHTNHRPSAWWLPMVDRSGEWFRTIADTAELYLEPLHSA